MASDEPPWKVEAGGIAIHLRLTPRGGRDAIAGVERLADGRSLLKARGRAAPEHGKANAALTELVAKSLGAPKSAARLVSGETGRVKKVFVAGDPAILADALAKPAQNG
ncbi:MAG: DUF167 family protein [Methylocystis sp.]|nr:DUF167 family protein [Methylocystis sp.]